MILLLSFIALIRNRKAWDYRISQTPVAAAAIEAHRIGRSHVCSTPWWLLPGEIAPRAINRTRNMPSFCPGQACGRPPMVAGKHCSLRISVGVSLVFDRGRFKSANSASLKLACSVLVEPFFPFFSAARPRRRLASSRSIHAEQVSRYYLVCQFFEGEIDGIFSVSAYASTCQVWQERVPFRRSWRCDSCSRTRISPSGQMPSSRSSSARA